MRIEDLDDMVADEDDTNEASSYDHPFFDKQCKKKLLALDESTYYYDMPPVEFNFQLQSIRKQW